MLTLWAPEEPSASPPIQGQRVWVWGSTACDLALGLGLEDDGAPLGHSWNPDMGWARRRPWESFSWWSQPCSAGQRLGFEHMCLELPFSLGRSDGSSTRLLRAPWPGWGTADLIQVQHASDETVGAGAGRKGAGVLLRAGTD